MSLILLCIMQALAHTRIVVTLYQRKQSCFEVIAKASNSVAQCFVPHLLSKNRVNTNIHGFP